VGKELKTLQVLFLLVVCLFVRLFVLEGGFLLLLLLQGSRVSLSFTSDVFWFPGEGMLSYEGFCLLTSPLLYSPFLVGVAICMVIGFSSLEI